MACNIKTAMFGSPSMEVIKLKENGFRFIRGVLSYETDTAYTAFCSVS